VVPSPPRTLPHVADRATVVTLHLPSAQVPELLQRLDDWVAPLCREHPDFRRLFCLESMDGPDRSQVTIVSLWNGAPSPQAEDFLDRLWDDTSQVLGVGIARQCSRVLRDVARDLTNHDEED
jgi:hypothetical protein